MILHGSLVQNLEAALASAKRLRGHPVHKDTLAFWMELLAHGRADIRSSPSDEVEALLADLQAELAEREGA